jgi:hypothetical protein
MNPTTPSCREATVEENFCKSGLVNRVKGFVEIQLEEDGRNGSTIAVVEEIRGISKTISNATA